VSTLAIDTWQTVNIRTKNVTEVLKWFLLLNSGTSYETNENSDTKLKKKKKKKKKKKNWAKSLTAALGGY